MKQSNITPLFYSILLCNILINSGCKKDWFDAKSDKRLTVPSSLQDFEYLLDDFVTMNQGTPGLGEVASDGHYFPESRWQTYNSPVEKNAYTWSKTYPYVAIPDWNRGYQKIFICNLVLDGLKAISPANSIEQQKWNSVKGNALFHRAKNYFDLSQLWAQPYKINGADNDVGIPLKEGVDVTAVSRRSTVQNVYKQVTNDLLTAAGLLPDLPQYVTRGSKAAAFALLARTYLVMQDYTHAGMYADSCFAIKKTLIDYNTISATNTNLGRFNAETLFFSQMNSWGFTFTSGLIFIDTTLFKQYDGNDLRKTRFFNVTTSGIVFKGNYNSLNSRFTGLATDEVYLIRAEAYARSGNKNDALKMLNDLLRKRWKANTFTDFIASTTDSTLDLIITERNKELLLRGIRWSDLRRLNQEDRYKRTITRTINGQEYKLEPDSYRYTFPLPDDVRELSSMPQSPGW